jgi:hypothetical protein
MGVHDWCAGPPVQSCRLGVSVIRVEVRADRDVTKHIDGEV